MSEPTLEDIDELARILIYVYINESSSERNVKITNLALPCIYELIVEPRYEFISILEILYEGILDDDPLLKSTIDELRNKIKAWILGSENEYFTRQYWPTKSNIRKVPPEIDNFFMEELGHNYIHYEKKYLRPKSESERKKLQVEVSEIKKGYLNDWLNPTSKPKKIIIKAPSAKETKEKQKKQEEEEEFTSKFKVSFKEKEHMSFAPGGLAKGAILNPDGTINEKLTKAQEYIDLKYIQGIDETKKQDKERYEQIFRAYRDITGEELSTEIQDSILNLWQGGYYSDNPESEDIVNTVEKHEKLTMLISGISAKNSRLILQTYILCLYMGKDVYTIYSIINKVGDGISPSDVRDTNRPSLRVQKTMNPIFVELILPNDLIRIRKNWEKLIYPDINMDDLIQYITNNDDIQYKQKAQIIEKIKDLYGELFEAKNPHGGLDLTRRISIEEFARKISKLIKLKIGVSEIIALLKYR